MNSRPASKWHCPVLGALLSMVASFALSEPGTDLDSNDSADYSIRGVVAAHERAALSVDFREQVVGLPFREGEAFSKGDVLIAFDCTVLRAQVSAARADYQAAKSRFENQQELFTHNATGELDVELSRAEMEKTSALYSAARGSARNCVIKAPFSGRVAALNTRLYETPGPEAPLIEIVGTTKLELQFVVPSGWLAWLKEGAAIPFLVDELGATIGAVVTRTGAAIDPISSTVEVFASIDDESIETILPGMSGTANLLETRKASAAQ